jgi:hypothetical protein
MHAHGDDQQHQRGGAGQGLECHAVDERAVRRDDGQREQRLDRDGQPVRRGPQRDQRDRDGHDQRRGRRTQGARHGAAAAPGLHAVHRGGHGRQDQQQPHRARHLAGLQDGERQRAVRDELALRNEDDARDREHQHRRQPEQRVDGAVGEAVEQQDAGDREVHAKLRAAAPPRWEAAPQDVVALTVRP